MVVSALHSVLVEQALFNDMENELYTPLLRLVLALLAGALIGLERTYHGRPAGFRTHILVCCASTLLMFLTLFYQRLIPGATLSTLSIDPTRMAQGIMTGIGFLGAGVIFKEGLTIRGLTTAASVWMTAAIGIIIGVGLYFPAIVAEIITLGTLAVFRWIEPMVPSLRYGRLTVRFQGSANVTETDIARIVREHSINFMDTSYHLDDQGFQYEMTIHTRNEGNFGRLAETFQGMEQISEFSITPSRD